MASTDNVLKYDGIEIKPQYRTVREQGIEIGLTNYEFEILYLLARHPGQVFSKEQIYNQVWGKSRVSDMMEPDSENPKRASTHQNDLHFDCVGNRV